MIKERIIEYARRKYGAEPEHLWMRWPEYAVLRHKDNGKWFAVLMGITPDRLGIKGEGMIDVMNVKVDDPLLLELLIKEPGHFRGWHMSRRNWMTVLLDGTVPFEELAALLDKSFAATASAQKKKELRPKKEWLVPANPKYYDIVSAFGASDEIMWKQGAGIKKGDTVFMYVGAPVSAILYKCTVTETDVPYKFADGKLTIKSLMRIKLVKRYPADKFTFGRLNDEFGIFAVRGPRGVPNALSKALK